MITVTFAVMILGWGLIWGSIHRSIRGRTEKGHPAPDAVRMTILHTGPSINHRGCDQRRRILWMGLSGFRV